MKNKFDSVDIYKLKLALCVQSRSRFYELIEKFGAKQVCEQPQQIKTECGILTDANVKSLMRESANALYERLYHIVDKKNIAIYFSDDEVYPEKLKKCDDCPNVIFVRGVLPENDMPTVAIVGTRKYTTYGCETADNLAFSLACENVCIVSGMAHGIDSIASKSAMRVQTSKCPTVAVLGSGIDVPTPVENSELYEEIIECGCVISQFAPGINSTRYTFPMRNKVIAGLSDALVVAEAGENSGAVITANAAYNYGRKVYCVTGRITDESFMGANKLIADGKAKPLISYESILKELNVEIKHTGEEIAYLASMSRNTDKPQKKEVHTAKKAVAESKNSESGEIFVKKSVIPLDENGQLIYNALSEGKKNVDELLEITGLGIQKLSYTLALMEVSGQVKQLQGGFYELI